MRRNVPDTREGQLEALDRRLVKIGLILVAAAVVFELLRPPGFSPVRLTYLVGAVLLGLLFGRALAKLLFLRRRVE